ncbi:MAG: hypothetical protein SWX82_28335 [Cyanobacteriota bacterium]|nr:hypothetical protein [Cyanobacteriota bacterium]
MKILRLIPINHNLGMRRWLAKLSFEQEVKIQESGEKLDWGLMNKSGNFSVSP